MTYAFAIALGLAPCAATEAGPPAIEEPRVYTDWEHFFRKDGLPADKVYCVAVDGQKVWAGTDDGLGVYDTSRRTWRTYGVKDGLAHRAVTALAVDRESRDVWAGTMGGLTRISAGRFETFTQLNSGLPNDVVFGVCVENQNLWVATTSGEGRYRIRERKWDVYTPANAPQHEPWGYAIDYNDGKVWAALWGGGALEFDVETERWKAYVDPDGEMEIDLFRDDGIIHVITTGVAYREKILWVSTYFGMSSYDGHRWRGYMDHDTGLASNFVNNVRARGRVGYACTDKGLSAVAYDTNRWVTYAPIHGPREGDKGWEARIYEEGKLLEKCSLARGLSNNFVWFCDFQGEDIWVATSHGLCHGIWKKEGVRSSAIGPAALLGLLAVSAEPPDDVPPPAGDRYADTPKELEPFGRFVKEPYKRFFLEPLEANGPGRDAPEPDVATVKIGLLAPLERTHEDYMGRPIAEGVRLAIEDANAAGGYKGKPFELVVRNDNGLWGSSASEIARFAYDDACWGIIGSVDSANTHIAIRVGLKIEIPIITPADTDPTFSETRIPWAFRNIPDDRQMIYTIMFYVFQELGLNRVAIVRANNRYGRFGVGEFRTGAVRFKKPAPIEINYEVHFENVNPDLKAQMERLEETKPQGVVLWADAVAAGHIVKAMRERGFTMPVFASDRAVHPEFLRIAGGAADGVIAAYPYNPERGDPAYDSFAKRYEERTGSKPLAYAAYAYDAGVMFVEAIRKVGLNRFRIRDALQEMKVYKGVTGEARFDHTLTNRAPVVLATVKGGRFVFDEPKAKKTW